MKHCPLCDKSYGDELSTCALDGARLSTSPAGDPVVGQVIKGRYRVLRKLGEGGMGAVYLADQLSISRKVALKVLHREFTRDHEFVQRFHQEARLAAALNHPAITTVFDFDQGEDGSLFIVMEYLEGTLLSEVIRRDGALDVGRAVRLGVQIADGLGAAHAAGVIHRDVKPQNIMVLTPGDRVKLMDFGIARMGDTGAAHLTRAGALMGTPHYMAPEQIEGRPITVKTDIYAFGVVLYEMLTGTTPFNAPTSTAVLTKQLREPPAPLRRVRPEVSPLVEQVVMQALEKEPEWRQENMGDLARRLRAVGGLPTGSPPSSVAAPAPAITPSVAPGPQVAMPTMVSTRTSDAPMESMRTIVSVPTMVSRPMAPSSSPEQQAPVAPSGTKKPAWARLKGSSAKLAAVVAGIGLLTAGTMAIALHVGGRPSPVVAGPHVEKPSVDPAPTTVPAPPRLVVPPPHRDRVKQPPAKPRVTVKEPLFGTLAPAEIIRDEAVWMGRTPEEPNRQAP